MSLGHCYPQLCQPLRMAGLCYLEDACRVLFVQIAPFAHTVKMLRFSLVETCTNSVAYFKDSTSRINKNKFHVKKLTLAGFEPPPVEAKISKAHELAGLGHIMYY